MLVMTVEQKSKPAPMPVKTLSNNTKKEMAENHQQIAVKETLTNGFFTVDSNWKVKYWNKAAEKLLAVKAVDITGKNIWETFAGVLPVEFYSVYQNAFLQNIPVHFKEYRGEMGAWFDVVTYYDKGILSVSFKSSNKPHAEYPENPYERLKVLTELYKSVTEITNDCLWEWDIQQEELFWIDGGHKRVFGYPIENALIPKSFWESCLHPDDKKRVLEKINEAMATGAGNIWQDEYRFKKANGEYAFVLDRGHIIYDNEKAIRMIGATQDITDRVLLANKLATERVASQLEMTNAVFAAQENERTEIGRELHDNFNQLLAITKMFIGMAKKDGAKRDLYLDKSAELVSDVIELIRKLTRRLVIPDKVFTGLFGSIKNLIADMQLIHPCTISFLNKHVTEAEIDEKVQVNIYRIIQEQLNNILKHSTATCTDVHLYKEQENLILLIADNGCGCNLAEIKKGVGSVNVMSRAALCNGSVAIKSSPGNGYSLKVTFPLPANN